MLLNIFFALSILASALIAGWVPFKSRSSIQDENSFPIFQALAAGIFLGVGLIHMLSDANADFMQTWPHITYPIAYLLAGSVFLILLYLEHLGREINHGSNQITPMWVIIAVSLLSIHSLLAGFALGMSHLLPSIVLFFGIIGHKWAAAFALSVQINKSKMALKSRIIYFSIFALMTPIGIFFGSTLNHFFNDALLLKAIFMALAAGTFLYIGTLHGLSRAVMVDRCCNKKEYLFVILGFAIMALIAYVA
jgi:solute carrier family 39 (zinc transporter), member 1/2/3